MHSSSSDPILEAGKLKPFCLSLVLKGGRGGVGGVCVRGPSLFQINHSPPPSTPPLPRPIPPLPPLSSTSPSSSSSTFYSFYLLTPHYSSFPPLLSNPFFIPLFLMVLPSSTYSDLPTSFFSVLIYLTFPTLIQNVQNLDFYFSFCPLSLLDDYHLFDRRHVLSVCLSIL